MSHLHTPIAFLERYKKTRFARMWFMKPLIGSSIPVAAPFGALPVILADYIGLSKVWVLLLLVLSLLLIAFLTVLGAASSEIRD